MNVSSSLQCLAVAALCFAACGGTSISGSDKNGSTSANLNAASGSGTGAAGVTSSGSTTGDPNATGSSTGAGAGSSAGSSSGTTTGAPPSCEAGAASCTPANICDNGCTEAGGGCLDLLTANLAETGTSCDAGGVCEGTTCIIGSGPQVPNNGGGVLANPNLVLMTWNSDSNQTALEQWGAWFMDGGILQSTLGQYGVGNGTIQFVHLTDAMPAYDQSSLANYLETHFTSDATMPANTSNNIYLLSFPNSWDGTSSFCGQYGGYHTVLFDQARNYPVWAVIADCNNDLQNELEVAGAHEIAEAATDPYDQSWTFLASSNSPWIFTGGGEVGDMCESNTTHYATSDGVNYSQYLWSNDAARLGQVPCQPWPADQVYVQTLGPATIQSVPPGGTANIPIVGWASAPTDPWGMVAQDPISGVDFQAFPTISSDTISPGQQVMVQLNIPAATRGQAAVGGQLGGAWIWSATDNSHFYGAVMVGVQISCETNADCGNPIYACTGGVCGYNYCGSTAKAFSKCTASQGSDGVCFPFDTGSTPVEICSQAGSLAVGTQSCALKRIVGGGASNYCDATSICEGSSAPACFTTCDPSTGCSGSQYCYPLGQSYGFCLDSCTSTACGSGTTCYNIGSGVDICYPN